LGFIFVSPRKRTGKGKKGREVVVNLRIFDQKVLRRSEVKGTSLWEEKKKKRKKFDVVAWLSMRVKAGRRNSFSKQKKGEIFLEKTTAPRKEHYATP